MDRRKSAVRALLSLLFLSTISFAAAPLLFPQPLSLGININITTTDKTAYAPGEQIKVTGSVFDYNTNAPLNGTIRASVVQRFSDSAYPANNNNTTTTNTAGEYTAYLTAPSTPGDYRVRVNASSTESVAAYVSLKVAAGTSYTIDLDKTAYAPGDNVTATVKVKDSTGSAVSNFTVNATLLYQNGSLHSTIGSSATGSNGKTEFSFTAPSTTGNYLFLANSLAGQTVRVIPFQVSTYVTDENDKNKWMFSPSENASIHAKVLDPNGNAYSATVTAAITTPSGTTTTISNFTTLATGKYKTAYTIGVEEGTYSVKTTASSGGSSVDAYTSFYVSNLYINLEKIETTGIANSSYTVTLTVKDASGNLKNGSTVNATITSPLGALVASYNATEDATTKRYKLSATNPADAGRYKITVTASTDGKTASTSWWITVQTLEIKVLTDKYKYSPGAAMSVSIETNPQTTITDLSYEIRDQSGSIVGIPVTNITAGNGTNGTASITLNAPKDSGYYTLFVNVNKKAYKSTGFEVKKYSIWTETRNGTSNSSSYKSHFDNSTPVYLHISFQTPDGGFVNLTSTISNFSYKLQRLYSSTDGKTYEAGLSFNTSYETTKATVAVLALNNSALPAGDYSIELRITDSAGSKEKTYGWFKMGGFYAFASPSKWQYTSSEAVNITVQAQSMNGTALANASVRVKSSKQADTWPYVDDSLLVTSILNGTTDANGTARLSLAATWAYGYHQVQIEVEKDGIKQQIYTGFSVQGFELTATIDVGNVLYPGQQYTITATAKSGDTPISGVNITRTEVRYANNWDLVNSTQQNFGVTGDTGSKSYTFTMPSDAKSGWYVIAIKGIKNTEVRETYLWVEVKSFDVKYYQNGQYQDWLWLGMVQPAAATPLIQIKVSQGGTPIEANVTTAYLVRTDVWPQETVNLSLQNITNVTTNTTTGAGSFQFIVPLRSKEGAQIQGGWYAIVLNVSRGNTSVLTEPWQSPQMEVRSYFTMLDLKNSRDEWAFSLMAGENASVQFRVEYPSNRSGVPNVNVSLLAIEYPNGTLYRNLTVQRPGNSTKYYQKNTTDANGNARLTLLYANATNVTESATPDETGQFVLVATAGSDTIRRWFDVSSFNTKIDMNNTWEFYLDSNLTFTAHATDANEADLSGVTVNISEVRSGWSWNQKTFTPIGAQTTGPSGAQFEVPVSSLNITEAGDYNLRVEFTQGSTRTSQWIWFRVKKYSVQVFPTSQFFAGQPLNFTVNATSGSSPEQYINATLVAIRDSWTWNVLRNYSGQYNTTTGSNGIGYLPGPSNLSKGFYIAEINVSDSPTFYTWFDIRAYEVNAWSNRQAYQQGENVSVIVMITPASNVTVFYTAYKPNGGQATGNFTINDSNRGTIESTGAQLSGLTNSSGYYQLKLLVSDPTDPSKYEERWISYEVRTFDAWAWLQPWQYAIGDNATANVNVYLGNTPLSGVNVSLAGIATRLELLNGTSETNMGLTITLLNADWGNQPDPTRWQPTEWASANISNSTDSALFLFNKSNHNDSYTFGNYLIKLEWMWNDWQNNNAPKANFRVYRDHTPPKNITGTSLTNPQGQATLNFPVQSDLKKGSYEPTIRLQHQGLTQDMPTWMEVIPFSYTAKLDKKAYNSGENATLNITATQPVNISVTGIMKWGWQPIENISFIPATKGTISPGQNISLNASGTIYTVALNNITKPSGSWSSKANISLSVNGTLNTSTELWQWNEEPVGDVVIKVMNILGNQAEIGISVPYRDYDKTSALINFTAPSEQAGYSVGLILQNGDTKIYDNIWFEVASLNVWGWTDKWSYNAGENVTLIIEARYGGMPATGLMANVTKIQKFNQSTFDWNTVNNTTSGMNATINSDGRAHIVFAMDDGGDYKAKVAVYAPSDPSTILGTTDIWFNSRLFEAWAWTNNWAVYLGDDVTIQVSTNPAQDNASIEVWEDNMTTAPFTSIEARTSQDNGDFKDMQLNDTKKHAYFHNSPDELNITFTNTSKACTGGKEDMAIGGLLEAWANLTIEKDGTTDSIRLTPSNSTGSSMGYTIRLNFLDCRPTGHSYHWLANGTTNAQGTGSATFNTTQLNDTTSLDHPLEVRVTKSGKTVTQFTFFRLKTFDLNAWFKGKEGWEPSFTPSENMTLVVKTVKNGAAYPNVSVTLFAVWKSCDMGPSGPISGGSGQGGLSITPSDSPGPGDNGGMACPAPQRFDDYLGSTDPTGMLETTLNRSRYNLTDGDGVYELKLKGIDQTGNTMISSARLTLSAFSVSLTPESASQGEPITVAIASTYVNGTVDIIETRYTQSGPTNVTLTNGTLDETGAGSIIINTQSLNPGYHQITVLVTYNNSGNMTTDTKSASFRINAYSLAVELDKQSYSPGKNMTVTATATKGGYGYQGVQVESASLYRTDSFGMGTWIPLSNVTTGPTGKATFTIQAPTEKGEWSLEVKTRDPSWNFVSEWAMFKVADAQINITTSSQILDLGQMLQVNATATSDTLAGAANMTFFLWKIYDPSTGQVMPESNITLKACYNKTSVTMNTTTTFNCTVDSLGLYLGIVVLGNTALTNASATLDDIAGANADAGYNPPEISVWVRNKNITAVEAQGRTSMNASTATSPQDITFNLTSNESVWMPFMIESRHQFPASLMKAMMKSVGTKQEDKYVNLTANLTEQAPDTSGDIYYLFMFTDRDLTASELFGGQGVPGDLARLVDIREVKITYAQAAANLKITSPAQGQVVTGDHTPVTIQKGGNLTGVAATKIRMDSGATRDYWEGMRLWDFNLTEGQHTLHAWLVNSTNGTIAGTYANVTFNLNRTCGQSNQSYCNGTNQTEPVNITITSPQNGQQINSSSVTVYYNITSGFSRVTGLGSSLDGNMPPSPIMGFNQSGSITFSNLSAGYHNVTLVAKNSTSTLSMALVHFFVNISGQQPEQFAVNITSPANNSDVPENVTVSYLITGNHSKVSNMSYRTYQGAPAGNYTFLPAPAESNGTFTIYGLAAGIRTIELMLMNASQQPMAPSALVTVNVTAAQQPEQFAVNITSPANNSNVSANFTVNYTITGNYSKVSNISYKINGGNQTPLPAPSSNVGYFSLINQAPGPETISVYLKNSTGGNMAPPATVTVNVQATNQTNLTMACQNLTVENATYTLGQNVSSPGTCFTILANNITLDGQGYTISYAQSSTGYAVNDAGGFDNLVIKNINMVQNSGIPSASAINGGGSGNGMANSLITNNTITTTGNNSRGIYLDTSSSMNTLSNNNIITSGVSGFGIYLYSSSTNTILNNTITTAGNTGYGIWTNYYSNSNTFSSNTITTTGNYSYGIYSDRSSGSTFPNNRIVTTGNNAYAIGFRNHGENNTITNGSVISQADYDYYLDSTGTTHNFTATNFTAQRSIYFYDTASWFNYNNQSNGSIWLKTNVSAPAGINRTLAVWSQAEMRWNDTAAGITAQYALTGLLLNTTYNVYTTSNGSQTNPYNLTTGANGNLSFAIGLSGANEIRVAYVSPNATQATLSGRVSMQNGSAVSGANFTFHSNETTVFTDPSGFYTLPLDNGMHNLSLTYFGLAEISGSFNLTENATLNLTMWQIRPISVIPTVQSPGEINVTVVVQNLESIAINATKIDTLVKGADRYQSAPYDFQLQPNNNTTLNFIDYYNASLGVPDAVEVDISGNASGSAMGLTGLNVQFKVHEEMNITGEGPVSINITSPANNSNVSSNFTVNYTITGNYSKVSNISYSINGGNQTLLPAPSSNVSYFSLTNQAPGPETIAVFLKNSTGGNMAPPAIVTVTVVAAQQPEQFVINITSPANNSNVSANFTVNYTITGNYSKVSNISYVINGSETYLAAPVSNVGVFSLTNQSAGPMSLAVFLKNSTGGNMAPPAIVSLTVTGGAPQSYSLSGRVAQQAGPGISGAGMTFHSTPQNVTTGANGTYNLSLDLGMHNLSVTYAGFAEITGNFNLTSDAELNLTMWQISPISVNATPLFGEDAVNVTVVIQNLENLTINATKQDTLLTNGSRYPQNTTSFLLQPLSNTTIDFVDYYNLSLGVPGAVEVDVWGTANGSAMGMNGLNVTFKIHEQMNISGGDGGPVSIQITSPTNGSNVSSNFTVNYTITGNLASVFNISYNINNGANITLPAPSSNVSSFNIINQGAGPAFIVVYLLNATGGTMGVPAMVNVTVTGGAPQQPSVTITSPANNSIIAANNFIILYNITGDISKVTYLGFAIDGGITSELYQNQSLGNHSFSSLPPISHTVQVFLLNASVSSFPPSQSNVVAPPATITVTTTVP